MVSVLGIGTSAWMLALALGWETARDASLFGFLGAMLVLGFLTTTGNAHRPRGRSWLANGLAALSVLAAGYFVWMAPVHALRWPMVSALSAADIAAAVVLCLLVLEATRRTIGMTLVLMVAAFLAYAVWGHHVPGSFSHRKLSGMEIIDHLVFTTNGLIGSALAVAAFLVFVFVLFGSVLDRTGGGDFFHDLASALVGRQVGGPAKVAVVSSALYGTISGSPTADVVTTGSITIPMMKRSGFSPAYAGGVEAAASTGGAILPPVMGSAAFLMSDFTGIAYAEIAIAATIMGVLYLVGVFYQVHARAVRDGLGTFEGGAVRLLPVLVAGWWHLVPIAALVWFVMSADRPVYGGAIAVVLAIVLFLVRTRDPRTVLRVVLAAAEEASVRSAGVAIACAVAGLVVGTLTITDLSGKFSSMLFGFAPDELIFVLLITALVTTLLGMGMPTPAVYVLAAVIAAPAMINLGVPVLAAHLFVVCFASMSAITPPVAVAAFAAASIADADPIRIGLIACRLAVTAFVLPFSFVFRPELLMQGSIPAVLWVTAATAVGVIAIGAGFEGWLGRRLTLAQRLLLIVAGLTLVAPHWWADAVGLALFALAAAWVRFGREPVAA